MTTSPQRMFDPYPRNRTLQAPASVVFGITPDDDKWLPRATKTLRIFNDTDEIKQIKIRTVTGNDEVLLIPPLCLLFEDVRTSKVYETGTSPELHIHGYSDL